MIPLQSRLENREEAYINLSKSLAGYSFGLGGNWDYDRGSFDRHLDEEQKVWLRIPFIVTHGTFDGDTPESDAVIQLGTPYVLKHLYKQDLDQEANANVVGALVNQFQEPEDKDAEIEPHWVEQAEDVLRQVETGLG
ncbi:hypothetical protein J31TS4_20180 [Paenibacillus sp. J31TS4]|uniref:YugN family protein n=1 Tax=Paenibacillus sp. J31TS4 TaxID=2807195 RepID=UPI001B17E75B|nr:YugN family protein [Paenibacillus sp. J31TS4]GIP38738.1 hypothetical protein J31TS4_20180 [Paenibacillus sp. J31TS4]